MVGDIGREGKGFRRPGVDSRINSNRRSATLAGRSIDDEGLEIQNEDIAGLVLTFTDKTTEVSGTVMDIRNQPDPGALVVVLPADTQAWRQSVVTPRRVRSVRTGAGGTFLFRDLPPGEYFLGAVSDAAVSNWSDTRTLDAISRVSIRISVTCVCALVFNRLNLSVVAS